MPTHPPVQYAHNCSFIIIIIIIIIDNGNPFSHRLV